MELWRLFCVCFAQTVILSEHSGCSNWRLGATQTADITGADLAELVVTAFAGAPKRLGVGRKMRWVPDLLQARMRPMLLAHSRPCTLSGHSTSSRARTLRRVSPRFEDGVPAALANLDSTRRPERQAEYR